MYTSGIVGRFFSSISNDWNSKFSHRVTSCYTIFTTLSTIIMNYGKFQHYHNLFCGAWFGEGPIRAKNASQNTGPEKKWPSPTLSVNFTISHTKQGLVVLFPLSFNIPKATSHNFAPLDVGNFKKDDGKCNLVVSIVKKSSGRGIEIWEVGYLSQFFLFWAFAVNKDKKITLKIPGNDIWLK